MARLTNLVPKIPLQSLKRAKIIATIGPRTDSYEDFLSLIKAGANGLRLKRGVDGYEQLIKQISWIRQAAKVCDKPVAIILDLMGPKLQLADFDDIITVQKNQTLAFEFGCIYQSGSNIPLQHDFSQQVQRGQRVFLYDGKVKTRVTAVDGKIVYVRAENDGILIKRSRINLPDSDFAGDIVTDNDRKVVAFGSDHDIDYIALGHVQDAQSINYLKRLLKNLGSSAKVIAKVETRAAVDNLEEIVGTADAIIIDRAGLAIETEPESVPIIQQRAIGLGLRYGCPTIVETQMLATLAETAEPTREEVADVASAVLTGADCLMLSDQAVMARNPVEVVSVIKRVIRYIEQNAPLEVTFTSSSDEQTRQNAISNAIINLARDIKAAAIVAETKSGATIRQLARLRPDLPLIAVTSDWRTAQQLAIVYGARSYVRSNQPQAALKLTTWLRSHKVLHKGDVVVLVSGRHPGVVGTTDTIKVRMLE